MRWLVGKDPDYSPLGLRWAGVSRRARTARRRFRNRARRKGPSRVWSRRNSMSRI